MKKRITKIIKHLLLIIALLFVGNVSAVSADSITTGPNTASTQVQVRFYRSPEPGFLPKGNNEKSSNSSQKIIQVNDCLPQTGNNNDDYLLIAGLLLLSCAVVEIKHIRKE